MSVRTMLRVSKKLRGLRTQAATVVVDPDFWGVATELELFEMKDRQAVRRENMRLFNMDEPRPKDERRLAARRKKGAIQRASEKRTVLEHYGGPTPACYCCGTTEYALLTIDHVGGGGNEHRRRIGGAPIYRWIISHSFPPGFRVACITCNWGARIDGICPHRKGS